MFQLTKDEFQRCQFGTFGNLQIGTTSKTQKKTWFSFMKNRKPTHPGEILLEEFLKPKGLSQLELARKMKVPNFG